MHKKYLKNLLKKVSYSKLLLQSYKYVYLNLIYFAVFTSLKVISGKQNKSQKVLPINELLVNKQALWAKKQILLYNVDTTF